MTGDWGSKRGWHIDVYDYGGSVDIALFKRDIDEVSTALQTQVGGDLERGCAGMLPDDGRLVMQLAGHEWTLVQNVDPGLAEELSETLGCDALVCGYQDTAGYLYFRVVQKGESVEEYETGPDYSEEIVEYDDSGEDPASILAALHSRWDLNQQKDGDAYHFRSHLRTCSEDELLDESFLDATVRAHGALVFGCYPDERGELSAPQSAFARIDCGR